MRSATCLTLLAIGAILTFAVTGHPSFLNLQVVGLIVMITGLAGLFLPRLRQTWTRRSIIVRADGREPRSRRRGPARPRQLSAGAGRPEQNGHPVRHATDTPTVPDLMTPEDEPVER